MTNETFKLNGQQPAPQLNDAGEFFADLGDHARELLVKRGIATDEATGIVNDLILHLAETFCGEGFYVTKKPVVFAKQMAALMDLRYMHYKDVDLKYGWSRGYSLKLAEQYKAKKQRREQLQLSFSKPAK